ncbi:hypothetical protein [Leadbettera azotonutricia]|uniref:PD-(D/E)XK nuclease family transposase n=1 Tax=Leadbettera azotonutricia (strain ATCC BAA-888 / DSM 13862 / ZAS-9) TaxID=545695 RepID=F5Y979_LEAAZ|nr:hypothetical protein [Leadbettera azotonutricia]AEF80074.1 hypothetical protein TREAZ_3241 [Leadbettera azotonutricia ZAS-9]
METAHLFDLVFKKLIASSPRGVIYLINALFNTNFPPDSPVEYLSTEHIGDGLGLRRSDTMIKINNSHTYNLEAQTREGGEMVIRVFEYGFMQARDTQILTKEKIRLTFPMPKIIYLDAQGRIPDMITLELEFPDNSIHEYKVGTFKIHDHAPEELFQQKMILLFPFYLLKLRHKVKKAKTRGELKLLAAELKSQIDDLTLLTKESGYTGILEKKDINTVQSLMERLFRELYTDYTELEGVDTMLVTEIKTYAEELEEKHAAEMATIKTYAEELEEKYTAEMAEKAERERQNKLDSARSLKALDVPVDKIVKALGLPLEVVEKL